MQAKWPITSLMPMRLNCIRPKRPYQTAETAEENLRIVSKNQTVEGDLPVTVWNVWTAGVHQNDCFATSTWDFSIFPYKTKAKLHVDQSMQCATCEVPRRWSHHGDAKGKPEMHITARLQENREREVIESTKMNSWQWRFFNG